MKKQEKMNVKTEKQEKNRNTCRKKTSCGFDTEGNPSDSVLTVIAQSLTKTSGRCESHYRNT